MADDKDNSIERLRALPPEKVFELLGLYAKLDGSYRPKDAQAQRFHVSLESGEVLELVVTGYKWFDIRSAKGGGGAIDLVMHLYGEAFPQAVRRLRGRQVLVNQTASPRLSVGKPEENAKRGGHLVPARNSQFFVADITDWLPKDDATSMEHPLFALKAGDKRVRVYERNGNKMVVSPNVRYGSATIHDKDLWIYCVSQLVAAKNEGREVGRTVRFTMYDFLRETNRRTDGDSYRRAAEMLNRLSGTYIETNIVTPGYRERRGFGLVDSWCVVERDGDNRMVAVEVELPQWLMCSIEAMQVLTLSRDYFRLRKPIDRRIYELVRKHCGQQKVWRVSMTVLHEKSGSSAGIREFRRQLKSLSESDELPDYLVTYEEDTDMVIFRIRKSPKAEQD